MKHATVSRVSVLKFSLLPYEGNLSVSTQIANVETVCKLNQLSKVTFANYIYKATNAYTLIPHIGGNEYKYHCQSMIYCKYYLFISLVCYSEQSNSTI